MTDVTAARLTDWSLLHFSGSDTPGFLHGQLTCDVLALQPGASTYGGYCNPKGRLLATFLLWMDDGGYTMLLPAAIAEAIRKRLAMYVLRAKVKIEDITAQHACIGITGGDAATAISALGGSVPEKLHGTAMRDGTTIIHLPVQRYLAIAPQVPAPHPIDNKAWGAADIDAGIPFIVPATQEEFVPQMVNLDLIGALSYTKGCYPGQEIVARTHYLGRLKQRMFRARVAAPADAGDRLYCADLGDQAAGMIVAGIATADGGSDVLAVLRTANAENEPYHLGSLQGPSLDITPLPYRIT